MASKTVIFFFVVPLLIVNPAFAETRFVTDQVRITLRTGESTEHKVLQMLPSGLPLEVLRTNEETGYSHVRTEDGDTGYVLSRLLIETPSARQRLVAAEQRLTELQQEPEKLASKLVALQTRYDELKASHEKAESDNGNLRTQLEEIRSAASDAVNIADERNMLRKRVAALNGEVGELKLDNQDLRNQSERKWFMMGAGAIVVGILLGLLLPRLRFRRRRDTWGSLSGF
jgi:SH3 domain protein